MTAVPVDKLIVQISQVRHNPSIPYSEGKDLSLGDLRDTLSSVRSELIEAISAAPDHAFTDQPENAVGEEVWSAGQIVGHCNSAFISIGNSALQHIGASFDDPPDELSANAEIQVMSRDEALAAANTASVADFLTRIPADADLDATKDYDFFGTMSCRAWIYFVALHEAEHVEQIRAFG